MPRLNRIFALKDIGFSLDEVAIILKKNMDSEQILSLLELRQAEILDKIKIEQERLSRVKNLIKLCNQEEYNMAYDIVIKNIDPIRVASLRDIIPSYSAQGHLWEELVEHIEKNGAKIVPPCMVIYHDSNYKEDSVDAEVIEPLIGDLPENERIKVKYLDAVDEMATVVHKGPFETLSLAYSAISKWIEDNGYEIVGAPRELYLKGEWLTNDPNEYITEIQFPVKKVN